MRDPPLKHTHTHFLTTRTAKNISGVQSVYIIDPECISHRVTCTKRLGRVNESVFVTEGFSGGGHLEHGEERNGKYVSF